MDAGLHCFDIATNALADLIFFSRHSLPIGEQGFVFAQIDGYVGAVKAADSAANDIADAILELGEDQLFLRPANMLHERLLGVLGRNAPEIGRSDFHFDLVA